MTSINAYVAGIKNVTPAHLDAALEEAAISSEVQRDILAHIWTSQRQATKSERKASDLPFITEAELEDGLWIEFFDLKGRLTDAFKDNVGIVEEQRVTIVVDGKLKRLNPDDAVSLFGTPIEPDEI